MNIRNPRLVISAASRKQWPTTSMPEILLCGRSNVGKSTFINSLVSRKNLAYVGQTPGKTRLLNFYNLDDKLMLVDAPGYGYQKDKRLSYTVFGEMMDDYFDYRENLCLCIVILDIRREPSEDDLMMIDFIKRHETPYILLATKCDKISYFQQLVRRQKIAEVLNVRTDEIILFAKNDERARDLTWQIIENIIIKE